MCLAAMLASSSLGRLGNSQLDSRRHRLGRCTSEVCGQPVRLRLGAGPNDASRATSNAPERREQRAHQTEHKRTPHAPHHNVDVLHVFTVTLSNIDDAVLSLR